MRIPRVCAYVGSNPFKSELSIVNEDEVILLAEDSEDDLILMRHAFKRAGVNNRVYEVRDGAEAVSYLEGRGRYANRKEHPLPCVIITDLKMPYDGMSFLKWLKGKPEFHRVPKLVLSSSGVDSDRNEAARYGACGYFVKPSGFKELINVVKTIDDDWISDHCPMAKSS